jgi:hypothetical protein
MSNSAWGLALDCEGDMGCHFHTRLFPAVGYLAKGGNITFLTFQGVGHGGSVRKFFYIKAAKNWLFNQKRA